MDRPTNARPFIVEAHVHGKKTGDCVAIKEAFERASALAREGRTAFVKGMYWNATNRKGHAILWFWDNSWKEKDVETMFGGSCSAGFFRDHGFLPSASSVAELRRLAGQEDSQFDVSTPVDDDENSDAEEAFLEEFVREEKGKKS